MTQPWEGHGKPPPTSSPNGQGDSEPSFSPTAPFFGPSLRPEHRGLSLRRTIPLGTKVSLNSWNEDGLRLLRAEERWELLKKSRELLHQRQVIIERLPWGQGLG